MCMWERALTTARQCPPIIYLDTRFPTGGSIGLQCLAENVLGPSIQAHVINAAVKERLWIHCFMTLSKGPIDLFAADDSTVLSISIQLFLALIACWTVPLAGIPAEGVPVWDSPTGGPTDDGGGLCAICIGHVVSRVLIEIPTQTTNGSVVAAAESDGQAPVPVVCRLESKIRLQDRIGATLVKPDFAIFKSQWQAGYYVV